MDEAKGRSLHQGVTRAQLAQQAHESSLHKRVHEEIEVGQVEVFEIEVIREALAGQEVDCQETRRQVFALIERPLVLKDERSS